MKRGTGLKVVNPVLGILVLSQMLSGFFGASLSHDTFELLHKDGAVLLAVVALFHLILNWNWVKATCFKRRPVA